MTVGGHSVHGSAKGPTSQKVTVPVGGPSVSSSRAVSCVATVTKTRARGVVASVTIARRRPDVDQLRRDAAAGGAGGVVVGVTIECW